MVVHADIPTECGAPRGYTSRRAPIRRHPRLFDGSHHFPRGSRGRRVHVHRSRAPPSRRAARGTAGLAAGPGIRARSRAVAASVRVRRPEREQEQGAARATTAASSASASVERAAVAGMRWLRRRGQRRCRRRNVRSSRGLPRGRSGVCARGRVDARALASLVPKVAVTRGGTADCRLPTADCRLRTSAYSLH